MRPIKLIFIGTDSIGTLLLEALEKNPSIEIVLVVTGLDKPVGRKLELQANAIKQKAIELGLPVFQPDSIKAEEAMGKLKSHDPDMMLVMAYGQILSQEVLDIPKVDCLNVHTSLLPKYRGASPIQSAILNGDPLTGISVMRMVQKMDAGPVYRQFELAIDPEDTAGSLWEKMAELAANRVPEVVVEISDNKLTAIPQNESEATYITKISKSDGLIDWTESAQVIHRKIRAFTPWPSAYTFFKGKRLKIQRAKAHLIPSSEPAGMVVEQGGMLGVVTGNGMLELIEVQPEGKKSQTIKAFLNGNPNLVNGMLGGVG